MCHYPGVITLLHVIKTELKFISSKVRHYLPQSILVNELWRPHTNAECIRVNKLKFSKSLSPAFRSSGTIKAGRSPLTLKLFSNQLLLWWCHNKSFINLLLDRQMGSWSLQSMLLSSWCPFMRRHSAGSDFTVCQPHCECTSLKGENFFQAWNTYARLVYFQHWLHLRQTTTKMNNYILEAYATSYYSCGAWGEKSKS